MYVCVSITIHGILFNPVYFRLYVFGVVRSFQDVYHFEPSYFIKHLSICRWIRSKYFFTTVLSCPGVSWGWRLRPWGKQAIEEASCTDERCPQTFFMIKEAQSQIESASNNSYASLLKGEKRAVIDQLTSQHCYPTKWVVCSRESKVLICLWNMMKLGWFWFFIFIFFYI